MLRGRTVHTGFSVEIASSIELASTPQSDKWDRRADSGIRVRQVEKMLISLVFVIIITHPSHHSRHEGLDRLGLCNVHLAPAESSCGGW